MRKICITLAICMAVFSATEAQTLKTPAPSTTQTIKQEFGLGSVELSYSRPGMKGRKVFGDLVPFGKIWRTGANQATTITFSDDVTIGGTAVKAGKYGLISIPDKDNWTLIVTKQTDITGPAAYKAENDVVKVMAKPMAMKDAMENFTMQFSSVKSNSCELHLMWENTAVSLPITADVDSKVLAQIDNIMNKDNKPYFNAAMYYMETGKDLNKSLTWFDKALEQNPKAFWIHHQKANCLAKLGKKADAIASANKSIELAKEAKNDDYVALNEKLLGTLK
jgi:hypothetical protein